MGWSNNLKPYRDALRRLIERLELAYVGMEEFTATGRPPALLIREKVEQSEGYLGVLGMRYGMVDPATGYSMTELEYRQAAASGKQIRMFVTDKRAPITADMVETDPEAYAKLLAFKDRVLKAHVCAFFTTVEDLVA